MDLGSAFAGALAALLIRSGVKVIANYWSSARAIAEYDCAEQGSKTDRAKMWHGHGRRVQDDLASNGVAWSHFWNASAEHEHTLFGPYTNDLGMPGYVRVRFRVSGSGFDTSQEIVLLLDVVQAPFDLQPGRVILGQRVVRAAELNRRYRNFDVVCYTPGVGAHEYRAVVLSGAFNEDRHHLHFDWVRVYRHFPIWDVL